jgi:hypothetical protein
LPVCRINLFSQRQAAAPRSIRDDTTYSVTIDIPDGPHWRVDFDGTAKNNILSARVDKECHAGKISQHIVRMQKPSSGSVAIVATLHRSGWLEGIAATLATVAVAIAVTLATVTVAIAGRHC